MPIITAESLPDYDTWGWDTSWSCDDWVQWHKALKKANGKESADVQFLEAWISHDGFIDSQVPLDCRSFNSPFRDYMEKEDLLSHLYSGLGIIAKPIGVAADIVGSGAAAVTNTAKVMEYLIPGLIIAAAAIVVFIIVYYTYTLTTQKGTATA